MTVANRQSISRAPTGSEEPLAPACPADSTPTGHSPDASATLRGLAATISGDGIGSEALARALRDAAERDLSLGRLLEGHANALQLIRHYADPQVASQRPGDAASGGLLGVWGADVPARPVSASPEGRLSGSKRFASGLGFLDKAIVTAGRGPELQLFLVDASDPARHDHDSWDMAGMQASCSGTFDCDGLVAEPIGGPGVYTVEPFFVGGTWRIAAVTLGGIVGLIEHASRVLRERGQQDAEAQLTRLAPISVRAVAAWPAILRAARFASGPDGHAAPEEAAVLSVSCRLLTEELGQDAIAAVERSVGLSMFTTDDPTGRHARDLACYMRQATRDAFLLRAGRAYLGSGKPLREWLDDDL